MFTFFIYLCSNGVRKEIGEQIRRMREKRKRRKEKRKNPSARKERPKGRGREEGIKRGGGKRE